MFRRKLYLEELKLKVNNGLIKVITGIRRCGKSFLLNNIFYNYLIVERKIDPKNIIKFAFDSEENIMLLDNYLKDQPTLIKKGNQEVINSRKFISFINDKTKENNFYYLLLDEIQNLDNFVDMLRNYLLEETSNLNDIIKSPDILNIDYQIKILNLSLKLKIDMNSEN